MITVPTLKRHVIPSNEILVTPWLPHSLSLDRASLLLTSTHLLRDVHHPGAPLFSSLPLFPVLHRCLITLQLLIPPLRLLSAAVKFGRRKSEGDSRLALTRMHVITRACHCWNAGFRTPVPFPLLPILSRCCQLPIEHRHFDDLARKTFIRFSKRKIY